MSNILLTGAACDIHSCTVSVTWLCVGSFEQCTEESFATLPGVNCSGFQAAWSCGACAK